LVEDNPANAHIAQLICERAGYVIQNATTGIQALKHLATGRFDLVLLDIVMPEMDGIEVARRIRSNPETAHIPLVFVTAMAFPDQLEKLSVLTPAGIVTKPFSPKTLLAVMQQALEHPWDGSTVITSPAQTLDDDLYNLASFGFIQEPGGVPRQEQELLAGVTVGLGNAGGKFGARQRRQAGIGVNPLLETHQAGLRDSDELGSGSLGQLLGFSQPVDQVPEPFS